VTLPFQPIWIVRDSEASFLAYNAEHIYHVDHASPDNQPPQTLHSGDNIQFGGRTDDTLVFQDMKGVVTVKVDDMESLTHVPIEARHKVIATSNDRYYVALNDKIYPYDDTGRLDEYDLLFDRHLFAFGFGDFVFLQGLGGAELWNRVDHTGIELDNDLAYHAYLGADEAFLMLRKQEDSLQLIELDTLRTMPFVWGTGPRFMAAALAPNNSLVVLKQDDIIWVGIDHDPIKKLCDYIADTPFPDELRESPCAILAPSP